MVKTAVKIREMLKEKGYRVSLVNARFVKPIDTEIICEAAKDHGLIVTLEENVKSGGFGEHVADCVSTRKLPVKVMIRALPDRFVEQGNVGMLHQEVGLDPEAVCQSILEEEAI